MQSRYIISPLLLSKIMMFLFAIHCIMLYPDCFIVFSVEIVNLKKVAEINK